MKRFWKKRNKKKPPQYQNTVPGMIEPIEQALLYELVKSIDLAGDEVIVEFGTFFGKSTRCIVDGFLAANNQLTRKDYAAIYVYDSYACSIDGAFYPHVIEHAKKGEVTHLLSESAGNINFEDIFKHYMKDLPSGILDINRCELEAMLHNNAKIKLIHFDLPKWYDDYKILLDRFSLQLQSDSYILYQDFFYHWSATLIAAVQYWINIGIITPVKTAASTLLVKLSRKITQTDLDDLERTMTQDNHASLIEQSIEYFEQFDVDRKSIFVGRLKLAHFQYCFEQQHHNEAADTLALLLKSGLCTEPVLANDLQELTRFGFSIRQLYQSDHS